MEIIMVSTTLDGLDGSKAKTSSQIFELEFAFALSKRFKVSIISLNSVSFEKKDKVLLVPGYTLKKNTSNMSKLLTEYGLFKEEIKVLIFFGYDYLTVKKLRKICSEENAFLISYTFDTHKGALEHRGIIKKFLIDKYFQLGIKQLKNVDGIILLNENAYKEMNLNVPYHISKIGIDRNKIPKENHLIDSNKVFKIIYAGALENYNGLKVMIDSLKNLPQKNIILNIYGEGNLKEYVINETRRDSRIKYEGLVTKGELYNEISQANLLLNLRDTEHIVNKYAFPSKLIQYMTLGIPVLSTNVIHQNEFRNSAFVIDHLNTFEVNKMINYIIENPNERQNMSKNAKKFVGDYYNWNEIILDLEVFFKNISK